MLIPANDSSPSCIVEAERDLEHALDSLAPAERLCIGVNLGEGMSHAEIEQATAIPSGHCGNRTSCAVPRNCAAYWEVTMDSFEARLASALTLTEQPSDEAFVQRVTGSIAASEEKRQIGLAMATLIVVCLAVALCYGMARLVRGGLDCKPVAANAGARGAAPGRVSSSCLQPFCCWRSRPMEPR